MADVPPGWKLVPIEPTWDMIEVLSGYPRIGRSVSYPGGWVAADAYKQMLAAAPAPPNEACANKTDSR
jgi:hypothetical protein